MKLGAKQELFSRLLPRLYDKAHELGFEIRGGELYRPKEMAAIYAQRGLGIQNSLHCLKLAIDFNLFLDGEYITSSEHPKLIELGEWWEEQHDLARWGGRFARRDGGHFSLEHGGVK